jgi:hypothetical protein
MSSKETNILKLYVWTNVLADWSSGMIVALAHSKEEALELVKSECGSLEFNEASVTEPKVYTQPHAECVWGGG